MSDGAQTSNLDKDANPDGLAPGTELCLGQYTIESFLSSGGFGITYLARDSLDRLVVIKECFPRALCIRAHQSVKSRPRTPREDFHSIVRKFVEEARNLARLSHPNIVGVHQIFEDNGTAYMALDYVRGRELLEVIAAGELRDEPERVTLLLRTMLETLVFIHGEGVLHRDISPDNILLRDDDSPILIDFGAARAGAQLSGHAQTVLRAVKDGYSPQEFYITGSVQKPASDLYALAATFHHLMLGATPPNSDERLGAVAQQMDDPYVPLAGRLEGYDPRFLAAIDRALAVFPKDRFQSAAEWLAFLDSDAPLTLPASRAAAPACPAVPAGAEKPAAPPGFQVAQTIRAAVRAQRAEAEAEAEAAAAAGAPARRHQAEVAPAAEPRPVLELLPSEAVSPAPKAGRPATRPRRVTCPERPVTAPARPARDAEDSTLTAIREMTAQEAAPRARGGARKLGLVLGAAASVTAVIGIGLFMTSGQGGVPPESAMASPADPSAAQDAPVAVFDATPETPTARSAPEVSVGEAAPVLALAAPAAPAATDPEPAEAVATRWMVDLPFTADAGTTIDSVASVAPAWLEPGLVIASVDGIPVATFAEIQSQVHAAASPGRDGRVSVTFATDDGTEHPTVLNIIRQTALRNGVRFRSEPGAEAWRTIVTESPFTASDTLLTGDELVAVLSTGEDEALAGSTALPDILSREISSGHSQFSFAVRRGGDLWVVSMDYSAAE